MSMSRAFSSSLAGFQVTTIGRYWVTAEGNATADGFSWSLQKQNHPLRIHQTNRPFKIMVVTVPQGVQKENNESTQIESLPDRPV